MTGRRVGVVLLTLATFIGVAVTATPTSAAPAKATGDVTVVAASSLTESFTAIGQAFEKANPDAHVTFSFGASSTLVTQVQQGAPADVAAFADVASMAALVQSGDVAKKASRVFTRNQLEIAVQPDNPKKIRSLADTAKDGVQLVLCAEAVPCGKYARAAYDKAGITLPANVASGENAKATLNTVSLGEADASVVYVTDVKAAKDTVKGVVIPPKQNIVAKYTIAPVSDSGNPKAAAAFATFVASKAGQKILATFGFLPLA